MPSTSLQGQTLGKYRVLEPLGRGGMAQVYRAYHPQLDRYTAIKVLRSDLVEEEEFLARFKREARAVAALRHANIVQVFDFDVQDDVYYMVMELLEGDTLKARLADYRARGERMPLGEIVRILLDVLDGLAYAHSEGMIHRDIKPANIILTRRGQAVLADFGIAQIVGSTRHTASGALMGTLNYIAPEQGLEGRSDARSDLYSLGIVLYEMLTQRTPFDADTPLAILMKHLNDPLPLPRQIAPDIPEALERIVFKALAKSPEDRYPGAAEMAQALRKAVEEAGIELPARISAAVEAPAKAVAEPAAVFSGAARDEIPDAGFAAEDTDTTLGQRLAEERAAAAATPVQPQSQPVAEPKAPTRQVGRKMIAGAVGLLVLYNLVTIMIAGLANNWAIFRVGWPIELFLLSLVLCAVMGVTGSIWMLVPVGLVLGNGFILSYYSLTNRWYQWRFLWPLEPLLLICTVLLSYWLSGRGKTSCRLSRLLAGLLALVALVMIGILLDTVLVHGAGM